MATYDERGFIIALNPNEVFVFGSNAIGSHRAGAAKTAHEKFGYPMCVSTGIVGQAYGIDTMGRKDKMIEDIEQFINTARTLPALIFYLTPIGTGIAGYKPSEMIPLFKNVPVNVVLPSEFVEEARHA